MGIFRQKPGIQIRRRHFKSSGVSAIYPSKPIGQRQWGNRLSQEFVMTIELYHTSHSTCSQKVRLALAEKGLPERNKDWVEHDVDLNKFEQLAPEYLKLNPNGVVSTLVHDDGHENGFGSLDRRWPKSKWRKDSFYRNCKTH